MARFSEEGAIRSSAKLMDNNILYLIKQPDITAFVFGYPGAVP
jgi:hypothetical protein